MSQGHLDIPVAVDRARAEFRELAETLERMRISQKAMMERLRGAH